MKLLLKFFILFPAIFNQNAFAQDDLCKIEEKNEIQMIDFKNDTPEYFFKAIMPVDKNDKRNQATVILYEKGNVLVDFKTGESVKIPGPFDAVPSIDGKIVTVPESPDGSPSMTIYSRENLKKPIFVDSGAGALVGVYQSVGILNSSRDKKTYRIITDTITQTDDTSGLRYKDYTIDNKNKVTPSNSSKVLCTNVKTPLKLPMLSKDGKKLAALNVQTGTSFIYEIEKDENGNSVCVKGKDLGFSSTKIEFSPDSSKITFASNTFATNANGIGWDIQPDPNYKNLNVFVMDLKTNKIKKISNVTKGNAYYPSFSRDNTVTYLKQSIENGKPKYYLVQSKVGSVSEFEQHDLNQNSLFQCEQSKLDLAKISIGTLWNEICMKLPFIQYTKMGISHLANSLNYNQCKTLVGNNFEKISTMDFEEKIGSNNISANGGIDGEMFYRNFENIRSLTKEDLLLACNKKSVAPIKVKKIDIKSKIASNNSNPLRNYCLGCHTAGTGRSFVVSDSNSVSAFREKAIKYVQDGYMPLGSQLNQETKDKIISALEEY